MAGLDSLEALFEDELRDVYDAERQVLKALPRMIRAASHDELRAALESHLEETRGQIDRLEQAFEQLDLKVRGKHCAGMAGILDEGRDLLAEDGDDAVLDAAFTAAAQRVEHYEITAYGSLIAWGTTLGYGPVVKLLQANLDEEKAADETLSTIAESGLNAIADRGDEADTAAAKPLRARGAGR